MNLWLFVVSLLLKLGDIGTTAWGINKYGLDIEMNPLSRWMFSTYGMSWTFLVIFVIYTAITLLLYKLKRQWTLTMVVIIMTFVVANNTYWILFPGR